jgi:NAD(P)-dependent dehydrogenase (short-subunit alcohol dehydrogenase family)
MVANAGVLLIKPMFESELIVTSNMILLADRRSYLATAEEWDRTFAVNARGVFLCYKYAGIQMVKQGRGGRIIGASSVVGKRGEPHLQTTE